MFPMTVKEDIWTNYLNSTGDQIYSTHTICSAFSQILSFKCWTTILGDKYNDRHVYRWEKWSVKRLAHSVRSLRQHFNLYLSDSKCSTSQCPTISISSFAFRKRSADMLGYCQKFFEVLLHLWPGVISYQSKVSIFLYQPWWWLPLSGFIMKEAAEMQSILAFPPDWSIMIQNSSGSLGLHWCQAT